MVGAGFGGRGRSSGHQRGAADDCRTRDGCGVRRRANLRAPAVAGSGGAGPGRRPGLNSGRMAGNAAAAASCAAGYLIGSVPFGLIVGKTVGGLDVRDFGSGNMGTANVLRTVGARAGAHHLRARRRQGRGRGRARPTRGAPIRPLRPPPGSPRASGTHGRSSRGSGVGRRSPPRSADSSWCRPRPRRGQRSVASALWPSAAPCRWVADRGRDGDVGAGLESSRRHDAVPFVFTALASALVIVRHAAEHPADRSRRGAAAVDASVGQSSLTHRRAPAEPLRMIEA